MPKAPLCGGLSDGYWNETAGVQMPAKLDAQAFATVEQLEQRQDALRAELADLDRAREAAVRALDSLAGSPMAEIRRLSRDPPQIVRHTLLALWLLLHCETFAGRAVRAGDLQWPQVQRMLAEEGFVSKVKEVTVNKLDSVPNVCEFLQHNFFTSVSQTAPAAAGSQTARERRFRASSRSSADAATPRSARGAGSQFAQLDARSVTRASQPCGVLVEWMLSIVRAQQGRSKLSKELEDIDVRLTQRLQERRESLAAKARADAEAETEKSAEQTKGTTVDHQRRPPATAPVAASRPPLSAPRPPMSAGRPLVPANWRFRPQAPPSFLLVPPGEAGLPAGEAPRLSATSPPASADGAAHCLLTETMKQIPVAAAAQREVPVRELVARYVQGSLPTELQSRLPRISGLTSVRRTTRDGD
eukprot:TRINITY_DN30972_c0_g1_i1.p1 TRINITY_DN30972_c0_g1~~TRINITY_DN30972_c0_g1_i1.p1  ORF type:complete len:416 (-),score=60.85 TRINITY_DN30972_c0_g1_i1:71-1318(-)